MFGRTQRVSFEEAKQAINKIAGLKTIFKEDAEVVKDYGRDETKAILLLSRFHELDKESAEAEDDTTDIKDVRGGDDEQSHENEETEDLADDSTQNLMSNKNKQKRRRLAMSFATLASKEEKRLRIVDEGAIPALIELSTINDAPIQRSCAVAFSFLSKERQIRPLMIEQAAFPALVYLSEHSSSRKVKADIVRSLCNLCMVKESEYKAVKEGVVFSVVSIANSCADEHDVVEICLQVLVNISCVADIKELSRVEDLTDALIHFNNIPLSEVQHILMMSALFNLSALKNNQLRLIEDGCLQLVDKAIKSHSSALRLMAANTVRNLTSDQRSRNKLVEKDVILTLVAMSRDDSEAIKRSCVQAFYNLSKDVACREKIASGPAVMVIIKMSMEKFEDVETGRTAARTLRVLCGDRNAAPFLISANIVKALMSLIKVDDAVIRQYCAESICSLFQLSEILKSLVDQSAVGVLVSLSQNNESLITGEWCAFALYHLATNPVCPTLMITQGVLPCIIKLCNNCSATSKYFCTAAIAYITKIKDVDASCAIPTLVNMLPKVMTKAAPPPPYQSSRAKLIAAGESSADVTVTEDPQAATFALCNHLCAVALYNLAETDSNSCIMLEAGALKPVVQLTQSQDIQTKMKCAAIISKLSLFPHYYDQFSEESSLGGDNVLKVLLELSRVDHTLTQRRVVLALSNLTQSPLLRQQLLKLKPMEYIITLATKPDENLRRGCVSIVCNLSYEVGSEADIMRANVMPTLLITAIVTSDKLQSKIICAKALVNLMADPKLHAAMVKEGIIWALSTLALLEVDPDLLKARDQGEREEESEEAAQKDSELLKLCLNAICTLSNDFSYEILKLSTAVKAIFYAIKYYPHDLDVMIAGGRTLVNLLLQTSVNIKNCNEGISGRGITDKKGRKDDDQAPRSTKKDEEFRKKAVEYMTNLVQCKNDEVSEISILCLCVASQSESCRETIVENELLKMIDVSTIFSQHRVSFAYLTMFGNIANNPSMRNKVLDPQCLSRFSHISMAADPALDMAVTRALYCLSCATDNLVPLVQQNILAVLSTIYKNTFKYPSVSAEDVLEGTAKGVIAASAADAVHDPAKEILSHMIATIYNLTTSADCHATLVSQGVVMILNEVWPTARDDYTSCCLTIKAIAHLACGQVNTTKMVDHGCGPILCFLKECKSIKQYEAYYFEPEMYAYGAAAFRNLCIAIPNQEKLVEVGVIPTLLTMSSMSSPYVEADKRAKHVSIHDNCAAALRSMTYNEALRQTLISSGAVKVLMSTMTSASDNMEEDDSLHIKHTLLCELEAESWSNGSRGKLKEGRAPHMETGAVMDNLLNKCPDLNLEVEQRLVHLQKYLVQVHLEELQGESESADSISLQLNIDDLASFEDSDETSVPVPMMCPKKECNVAGFTSGGNLSFHTNAGLDRSASVLPAPSWADDEEEGSPRVMSEERSVSNDDLDSALDPQLRRSKSQEQLEREEKDRLADMSRASMIGGHPDNAPTIYVPPHGHNVISVHDAMFTPVGGMAGDGGMASPFGSPPGTNRRNQAAYAVDNTGKFDHQHAHHSPGHAHHSPGHAHHSPGQYSHSPDSNPPFPPISGSTTAAGTRPASGPGAGATGTVTLPAIGKGSASITQGSTGMASDLTEARVTVVRKPPNEKKKIQSLVSMINSAGKAAEKANMQANAKNKQLYRQRLKSRRPEDNWESYKDQKGLQDDNGATDILSKWGTMSKF